MQFVRDQDWRQVIRVTGPTHNLLGLRFGAPRTPGRPDLEALPSGPGAERVAGEDVEREVAEGVSEANADFGADYSVAAIRYVPSDTPSPDVYRMLAWSIVERAIKDPAFGS